MRVEGDFPHRVEALINFSADYDTRAPGGAITQHLCGHWEHEGPCIHPHFTSVEPINGDVYKIRVAFRAAHEPADTIASIIVDVLNRGVFTGPDGHETFWSVEGVEKYI